MAGFLVRFPVFPNIKAENNGLLTYQCFYY